MVLLAAGPKVLCYTHENSYEIMHEKFARCEVFKEARVIENF